jgi:hypothetical protein
MISPENPRADDGRTDPARVPIGLGVSKGQRGQMNLVITRQTARQHAHRRTTSDARPNTTMPGRKRPRATSAAPPPTPRPLIETHNLPVPAKKPRYANGHAASTASPVPYGNHAHLKKAREFHAAEESAISAPASSRAVFKTLTEEQWKDVTAQIRKPGQEVRKYQLSAADSLLEGNDTVLAAATGKGKSWVFYMAALANPYNVVLVVVPLKSLGRDQCKQ